MNLSTELLVFALETELEQLKESNRSSWDMYGSELCAGSMIGEETHIQEQINKLKESLF